MRDPPKYCPSCGAFTGDLTDPADTDKCPECLWPLGDEWN